MLWLIFTVLLGLVALVAILTVWGSKTLETRRSAILVAALAIGVWIVVTFFASLYTVGQREVGVQRSFSGAIVGKKTTGWGLKAPWTHIDKQNVGLQREDFDLNSENAAVSQDLQSIFAKITLNYQVEPDRVVQLYKRVGPSWKQTLLDSRVLQDFKEVTSQFPASDITTQRGKLRKLTKERLTVELAPYDIKVIDFFVRNIDYSNSYSRAIDAKNRQVQRALQAKAKVAQARYEGQQALAKAQSEARANRLLARSVTPQLVRLRQLDVSLAAVEKLNPNVRIIYLPANANLFLPGTGGSR